MKRRHDFRGRLTLAVSGMMGKPFAWGANDCVVGLFVPVVLAVTGKDLSGAVPAYDSEVGAKRALKKKGLKSLEALALEYLDGEIDLNFARVGDIAILEDPGIGKGFGVVQGARIGVLTLSGYGTVDRSAALVTYRVGE